MNIITLQLLEVSKNLCSITNIVRIVFNPYVCVWSIWRNQFIFQTHIDCTGGSRKETETCCSSEYPCKEFEGDCDTDDDCEGSLICGIDNCGSSFKWPKADCCGNGETRSSL